MPDESLRDAVARITGLAAGAELDDLGAVLHDVLAQLGPLLEVDRAYLIAIDSTKGRVLLADEWYKEGSEPALSTVISMGPLAREEEIRRRLASRGVKSVLMVPARPAGALTGTMFVATSRRNYAPNAETVNALEAILDAFVNRLVGLRADRAKLAMRNELGGAKPELPAAE